GESIDRVLESQLVTHLSPSSCSVGVLLDVRGGCRPRAPRRPHPGGHDTTERSRATTGGYAIGRRLVSAGALLLLRGLRRRFRRLPGALRRRLPGRFRWRLRRRLVGGLLALLRPAAVDGLPQRLHEIDDVTRGLLAFLALAEGLLDVQGLTLIDLGVDELPQLLLVVIGELLR